MAKIKLMMVLTLALVLPYAGLAQTRSGHQWGGGLNDRTRADNGTVYQRQEQQRMRAQQEAQRRYEEQQRAWKEHTQRLRNDPYANPRCRNCGIR